MAWPEVKLGDVCSKPQYGAIAKGSSEPIGPRFVRQTDIASGRVDWSSVPYCDLPASDFDQYAIHPGDLLISRLGNGVGNAATVRDHHEAVFAGYLVRFRPFEDRAVPGYVGYQLQSESWRQHVASFRSGAAQPTLNAQQMSEFRFLLPSVKEQQAIAAALGALDDKIESNDRVSHTASDLLDAMAARAASDLPAVPLDRLVTLNRGTVNPALLGETLVHHFSLPAFDEGALPEEIVASEIKSNKTRVGRPSVLVSRLNPRIDRAWWATPDPTVPALASTEFACLEGVEGIDLAAVWLAVRDPAFRTELIHRVTGTSGSHQRVRPDDLLAIEVMDARLLTKEMTASASALLALIGQARMENRTLAALRDVLLPELLSGRIRVRDLEVESK